MIVCTFTRVSDVRVCAHTYMYVLLKYRYTALVTSLDGGTFESPPSFGKTLTPVSEATPASPS